ncbi:cytochrome P450 monooxygenase-like protein [Lineolata rhizophorae]|uniref:Cytochrome P450 monooxygenase-like protein n=1 Tax=Lineolata rhizophorae TaxID=578093 RepID=A0A6A6NYD1_9PEZI|nr:cytochrome P450 monooxygenase-like protein [Lineolata rhizophorae]
MAAAVISADTAAGWAVLAAVALLTFLAYRLIYRVYLHPLARFPGPPAAAVTWWWKTYVEVIRGRSFCHALEGVHAQYGDIIRIGPDELHFANPQAYLDIYNAKNRWNKEPKLYHCFNEDRSSFGFLTYREAKERKDILNKTFSPKAIEQVQGLVLEKVDALAAAFDRDVEQDTPTNMSYAFRCMTMDIITYLCFGHAVDALKVPNYRAPIIEAMDAALGSFVLFRNFEWFKSLILGIPPRISRVISPPTRGLAELQLTLLEQISELTEHPESLDHLPHKMTIYHALMDKDSYQNGTVPSAGSLYEEAQALMFAGGDTTGNTLMMCSFHLMKNPEAHAKLRMELRAAWPDIHQPSPSLRELEKLPYLNGVIKEGLRLTSGVVSGLLRIVPPEGAKIAGTFVPGGTIVSCGSTFVHYNPKLFPEPQEFRPERWIENPSLDNYQVAFSKGPRMCLGINLAWVELRYTVARIWRFYDMKADASSAKSLPFRDTFLPSYEGAPVMARMEKVTA